MAGSNGTGGSARRPVRSHYLNYTANRFQLLRPKRLGPIAQLVRESGATSVNEWLAYYENHPSGTSRADREAIARELHAKIREVVLAEVEAITVADCEAFIEELVGPKSYAAIADHERRVRELLRAETGLEWRAANRTEESLGIDAVAIVRGMRIGVSVKPLSFLASPTATKDAAQLAAGHARFTAEHGGRVFTVVHDEQGEIDDPSVFFFIRAEMARILEVGQAA